MINQLSSKVSSRKVIFPVLLAGLLISLVGLYLIRFTSAASNVACITTDATVDNSDLTALIGTWGTNSRADLNGDSIVNVFDLSILLSNWGQSCSTSSATFGNTTQGSSWTTGLIADDKFVEQFNVPASGSITKLSYYLRGDIASSQVARAIVYADNSGVPGALLGVGNEVTVSPNQTAGWVDFSFASPVAINSGNVWIGLIRGATGGNIDIATNTSGGVEAYANNSYLAGPTDPFGTEGGTSTYAISGYATYLTSGGGTTPTVSLSANPTSVTSGSASTLTWSSTNAASCSASGAWSGSQATSGSTSTGNLTTTSTYNLSCTGTGGTANASATVSVNNGAIGNGIGIVDYNNLSTLSNLNQYNTWLLTESDAPWACPQNHPRSMAYVNGTDITQAWDDGVDYQTALNNGWLLRDSSGNYMEAIGYPNYWLGDVGNPAYQQAFINGVNSLYSSYHCTGIFIDLIARDVEPLYGEYPTKYPDQASWQAAILSFIQTVGSALRAEGYYVVGNVSGYTNNDGGSSDGSLDAQWFGQVGPYVDGMMSEGWQQNPSTNAPRLSGSSAWYQFWDGWQQLVSVAQNLGDDFVGLDYSAFDGDTQMMRYGKGSFLLQWNGGNSVYMFNNPDGSDPWDLNWTYAIGQPTAAQTEPQSGVWERTYTNGIVIVNPTSSTVTVSGHTVASGDAYIGP